MTLVKLALIAKSVFYSPVPTVVPMATAAAPAQGGQPPADAPVQQARREREPSLKEGYIQPCQGYLRRRSSILRRWKKEWLDVVPGMHHYNMRKFHKK